MTVHHNIPIRLGLRVRFDLSTNDGFNYISTSVGITQGTTRHR